MVQTGRIVKNPHRHGASLLGLLLVAILGVGCGTSTPTHSAHKALHELSQPTIAPTSTAPAPTTTTAPPPPVTTTTVAPPRVIIVEVPATTVPTTIPPPPPCQAGGMLLIPGTDLVPNSLDAVGTVYWETEAVALTPGPATFDSTPGLCTYVSPPKGMAVVCPANDAGVRLQTWGDSADSYLPPVPASLWAPMDYYFSGDATLRPFTYAGWNWYPGTTVNGQP